MILVSKYYMRSWYWLGAIFAVNLLSHYIKNDTILAILGVASILFLVMQITNLVKDHQYTKGLGGVEDQ